MADGTTWHLLLVDDDTEICRQVQEFLETESIAAPDDRVRIETLTDGDLW